MLSGIFHVNLDNFDICALVAAILLVIAAVLARPVPAPTRSNAYASTVAFIGLAVFAFGFLFMTP